jgi:hypothetical protein
MAEQKERMKRAIARVIDYKNTFSSEEGKRVLYDILRYGNILATSHHPGVSDETAFQEGRRDMALYIFRKLKTDEKKLIEILDKGEEYERDSYEL